MITVQLIHAAGDQGDHVSRFALFEHSDQLDGNHRPRLLLQRDCVEAGPGAPANSSDFKLDLKNPYPIYGGGPSSETIEQMAFASLVANGNIAELSGSAYWADVKLRREHFGGFLFVPLTSALLELSESEFDCIEQSVRASDPTLVAKIETMPATMMLYELVF